MLSVGPSGKGANAGAGDWFDLRVAAEDDDEVSNAQEVVGHGLGGWPLMSTPTSASTWAESPRI